MVNQLLDETPFAETLIKNTDTASNNGLCDYHIHTEASHDSEENIYNICSVAVKAGLSEIAITDHYDCNYDKCKDILKKSVSLIEKAKDEYYPDLLIKTGIEIGEANQFPDIAAYAINNYDFDFILASIHNVRNRGDFYWMKNESDKKLLISTYFDELIEICKTCDFDVLAHLTYPLRYEAFWTGIEISDYDKQITEIFKLLAENGKGLEINTAALRTKNYKELSPTVDLIKYYKSLGGEIITLGSDAHKACDIAADFDIAVKAAKEAGFSRYATYSNRVPSFVNF